MNQVGYTLANVLMYGGTVYNGFRNGMAVEKSLERKTGMDNAPSGGTAPAELIVDREYADERFVDMMAAHHQMAIEMAKVAQEKGEHEEIQQLAENMISVQQGEIEELSSIKGKAFGSSEVATTPNPAERTTFAMFAPDELADQQPFDKAFIDSNIPHHASAIEMASVALMQSENPEIKRLARQIVDTQSQEVGQMIAWRQEWYSQD